MIGALLFVGFLFGLAVVTTVGFAAGGAIGSIAGIVIYMVVLIVWQEAAEA